MEESPLSSILSLPVAKGVSDRIKDTGSLAIVLSSPNSMRTESRPQSRRNDLSGREKLDYYESLLKELGITENIEPRKCILLSDIEREILAEVLCLDSNGLKEHTLLMRVGNLHYVVAKGLEDLGEWAAPYRNEHLEKAAEAYSVLEADIVAKRNLGLIYLELAQDDRAIEYVDAALKELRKDPGLWVAKGILLHRAEELSDARKCFDRAIKLLDDDPYTWTARGRLLIDMSRLEEALDSFDEAIVRDKTYLPAWREKLDVLLRLGKRDEAELVQEIIQTMLTKWEDIEPQSVDIEPIEPFETGPEPQELMHDEEDVLNFLLQVDGIGEAKAETIVAHGIDSINGLKKVSVEDLASLKGISEKIAQEIKEMAKASESKSEEGAKQDWDVQNAMESAGLHLEDGEYEKALAEYTLLLQQNPNNEIAWINKAEVLRSMERAKEAVEAYDRVLSINEANLAAWIEKANILLELGKPLDAVECYKKVVDMDSGNASFLLSRAKTLSEEKKFNEAILCFNIVLDKHPENIEGNLGVVIALLRLGDLDKAEEALEKVTKLTSSDERIWWAKGLLMDKRGRWGAAIQFYDRAISLKWDYKDAWIGKGDILLRQGHHNEAMKCFEKVLEMDSKNVDAWIGKTEVLDRRGERTQALDWLDGLLDLYPNNGRAIKLRESLQTGKPGDYETLIHEAGVQRERGEIDLAVNITIRAIKKNPDEDDAWTLLGDLLLDIADPIRVLNKLERETSETAKAPTVLTNKGALLLRLGMYANALKCFDKALSMDRNHDKARRLKERCLEKTRGI